jgi:glycosyltransferase involved in cell wall biosynthesis
VGESGSVKPKLTFVMPSIYDRFLKEAIESLLSQTMTEFEVIIFDNAKQGRGIKIDDSRFRILETGGWSASRCNNVARDLSNSDILVQAHDDNVSFPERARLMYEMLSGEASLAYSSCILIDKEGNPTGVCTAEPFDLDIHLKNSSRLIFSWSGWKISDCPDMDETLTIIYDYDFALECALLGKRFAHIVTPLGYERVWKNITKLRRDIVLAETNYLRQKWGRPDLRCFCQEDPWGAEAARQRAAKYWDSQWANRVFEENGQCGTKINLERAEIVIGEITSRKHFADLEILDIGCGSGFHAHCVSKTFPAWRERYLGIDLSKVAVEHVRKWGFKAEHADLLDLETDRKFGLFLLIDSLEHIENHAAAASKISGLAASGARIFGNIPLNHSSAHCGLGFERPVDMRRLRHFLSMCGANQFEQRIYGLKDGVPYMIFEAKIGT